jgi:hypothetical protein
MGMMGGKRRRGNDMRSVSLIIITTAAAEADADSKGFG